MTVAYPTDSRFATYQRFDRLAYTGGVDEMRELVNQSSFAIVIPADNGTGQQRMNLDEFARYMRRLRSVTTGLGQEIDVHDVRILGGMVIVQYTCAFTIMGRQVAYVATDCAQFDVDDKIVQIDVLYSLRDNRIRAFGEDIASRL